MEDHAHCSHGACCSAEVKPGGCPRCGHDGYGQSMLPHDPCEPPHVHNPNRRTCMQCKFLYYQLCPVEACIYNNHWWWLSFIDPAQPEGHQFLGVVIVEASGFLAAIKKSYELGLNPGGEVKGMELEYPDEQAPPQYRNRLVKKPEILEIGAPPGSTRRAN